MNPMRGPRQLAAPLLVGALLLAVGCAEEDPAEGSGADQDNATQNEAGQDSADGEIELSEVQENDSPESCWAAIEDTVYDLTDWIDEHPGGSGRIEQLCGTDATAQFTQQHGGEEHPESHLAEFEIGILAD